MTKAQQDFIQRKDEDNPEKMNVDSLGFDVWYHQEDVQRIVWALYQDIPLENQTHFMSPYVFYDGVTGAGFEAQLLSCKKALLESDKTYFPFIAKPEIASAHYMTGFLCKSAVDAQKINLILLNPTGYNSVSHAIRRLELKDFSPDQMIVSSHHIQDRDKDDGIFTSCGPLSIELLKYGLEHPDWLQSLQQDFVFPSLFQPFIDDAKTQYQARVLELRQGHYELLGHINDDQLSEVEHFYEPINQVLFPDEDSSSEKSAGYDYGSYDDVASVGSQALDAQNEDTENDDDGDDQNTRKSSVSSNEMSGHSQFRKRPRLFKENDFDEEQRFEDELDDNDGYDGDDEDRSVLLTELVIEDNSVTEMSSPSRWTKQRTPPVEENDFVEEQLFEYKSYNNGDDKARPVLSTESVVESNSVIIDMLLAVNPLHALGAAIIIAGMVTLLCVAPPMIAVPVLIGGSALLVTGLLAKNGFFKAPLLETEDNPANAVVWHDDHSENSSPR